MCRTSARARASRASAGGAAQCARAGLTDFANAAHDGHSLRGCGDDSRRFFSASGAKNSRARVPRCVRSARLRPLHAPHPPAQCACCHGASEIPRSRPLPRYCPRHSRAAQEAGRGRNMYGSAKKSEITEEAVSAVHSVWPEFEKLCALHLTSRASPGRRSRAPACPAGLNKRGATESSARRRRPRWSTS